MSAMILMALLAAGPEPLVEVHTRVPDAVVDLRYATPDNFMKKQVYPADARCLLLERSAAMLARAADALRAQGYRVHLYDCYRPHPVQFELWKALPVEGYVANPAKGSNHSRGGAVDLTLERLDGGVVEMPSPYDFFGPAAHHGADAGTPEARVNRERLRSAMESAGFVKNRMEWWHYDLRGASALPLRSEPFTLDGGR